MLLFLSLSLSLAFTLHLSVMRKDAHNCRNNNMTIRALDASSIRQLCAGQVLSTLSGVIKELVENSLDAGASKIEVYFESFGLDKISVADDGSGISIEEDVTRGDKECLLLAKRATSKRRGLTETSTLSNSTQTDSLGFRGEALHSLAQLAVVHIHTKTERDQRPLHVTYDSATNAASVSVDEGSVSLGSSGTVVTVTELFARYPVRRHDYLRCKKKQLNDAVALLKQYSLSRPDVRVICQHRPSSVDATVTLCSTSGSGDVHRSLAEAYGGRLVGNMQHVSWDLDANGICCIRATGYISCVGSGRATSDLQVMSLDGRLVEIPRVAKALQDTFAEHHPNAASRVAAAFFLQMHTGGRLEYDVNLTPDKRKILLAAEDSIIEAVRRECDKLFRLNSESIEVPTTMSRLSSSSHKADNARYQATMTPVSSTSPSLLVIKTPSSDSVKKRGRDAEELDRSSTSWSASCSVKGSDCSPNEVVGKKLLLDEDVEQEQCTISAQEAHTGSASFAEILDENNEMNISCRVGEVVTDASVIYSQRRRESYFKALFPSEEELAVLELQPSIPAETTPSRKDTRTSMKKTQLSKSMAAQTADDLSQTLCKSSFTAMQVHGQFNHGFILTTLGDDMYIIDQHASDEKYNYEQLVAKYNARPQPLVKPVRIAMEAREAELALEHKAELRGHGFLIQPCPALQADSDGCTAAVLVCSVPVLPYDTVTPQDVCELTQQLLQYGSIVRPLRSVWHSMATKACRSSIMIGTVLSDGTMRDIVDHLSTMDQPWNCPHGRPTLRHIGHVSKIKEGSRPPRQEPTHQKDDDDVAL